MGKSNAWVSIEEASRWINAGIFTVEGQTVYKDGVPLKPRRQPRNGCKKGDLRVDLNYKGRRRSCNISQVVWMWHTRQPIPTGFEIHHMDGDIDNNLFENLLCLHADDHGKIHAKSF